MVTSGILCTNQMRSLSIKFPTLAVKANQKQKTKSRYDFSKTPLRYWDAVMLYEISTWIVGTKFDFANSHEMTKMSYTTKSKHPYNNI